MLALVLLGLRLSRPPYVLRLLFRIYSQIGPWAMIEVFLVGFFVAYTRLVNLATVDVGAAAWGLGGLMLAIVAADVTLTRKRCGRKSSIAACRPFPRHSRTKCALSAASVAARSAASISMAQGGANAAAGASGSASLPA